MGGHSSHCVARDLLSAEVPASVFGGCGVIPALGKVEFHHARR